MNLTLPLDGLVAKYRLDKRFYLKGNYLTIRFCLTYNALLNWSWVCDGQHVVLTKAFKTTYPA